MNGGRTAELLLSLGRLHSTTPALSWKWKYSWNERTLTYINTYNETHGDTYDQHMPNACLGTVSLPESLLSMVHAGSPDLVPCTGQHHHRRSVELQAICDAVCI